MNDITPVVSAPIQAVGRDFGSGQDLNYFARLGAEYIERGYPIIPIKPGDKRPMDSAWPTLRMDLAAHAKRTASGAADAGIGILASARGTA